MKKKILLIIGILAIVGVAAFLMLNSGENTSDEEDRGFSILEFLPFGKSSEETETQITEENGGEIITETNQPVPRIRKISSEPVAGAVVFNVGTTSVVRFVEKGTGNVYEARSNLTKIERLTNTTIPKIARAFWLPNASGFLAQTLSVENELVETSFVKLIKSAGEGEDLTPYGTTISKLPTGIEEIAIKPDGSKVFYYIDAGYSNWFISNPDGTGSSLVLSHPLSEWLPKWISSNIIIMQSKPSFQSAGFYYSFDVSSKVLKKIGTGAFGLIANTNSDGSLSIVSNGGTSPSLFLVTNTDASTKPISASSMADKCVWSGDNVYCAVPDELPSGSYPDDWYKGVVSTGDSIERIDPNNDISYVVSDLASESGEKIDVVDLIISSDKTHLVFRNKIDGYLWMFRIEE